MTDRKMLIIVPTRSRPENVAKVVDAWESTGAPNDGAHLMFAVDDDDPARTGYDAALTNRPEWVRIARLREWRPMVHKLDTVARWHQIAPFAIGFAGDDHLPRTRGWAGRYMDALAEMGTGIVSCADGYRTDQLPTQWAMTSDIVRALGRMVPAPVEHLYCDDAIRDLGIAAGCYRYFDDVLIEHMHPLAKRGQWDEQYRKVNNEEQYALDAHLYEAWAKADAGTGGFFDQAEKVRALMAAHRA